MNAMKLAVPALLATAVLLTACQTPAPAPEPAPPPPVVQNQKLSTHSLFAFGKYEIAEDGIEGRAQLDAFAADLRAGPPYAHNTNRKTVAWGKRGSGRES